MISEPRKRIYVGAVVVAVIIIAIGWLVAERELSSYPAIIPVVDQPPAHKKEQVLSADKPKSSAQVNKPALPTSGGNTMEIPTVAEPVTDALPWQRRIIVETYANRKLDPAGVLSRIISNPEVKVNRLKHLNFIILEFPPQSDIDRVVELLGSDASVKHISKDAVMEMQQTSSATSVRPNDPEFRRQWSFEQSNDVDADLPEAWAITRGSTEIIVAIIDTGIDYTHPDLAENLWINQAERDGEEGVDDDGNGYIDDIYGWDTIRDQGQDGSWGTFAIGIGHGTKIASIIGAVGNNEYLLAGMNWGTRLLAITAGQFLQINRTDAFEAIDYIISLKMGGHDIRVVNASFSGIAQTSTSAEVYESAISKLEQLGILLVASAGNDGQDITGMSVYPTLAPMDNVIAVGSIDRDGDRAKHSDYSVTEVDLAAPGEDITVLRHNFEEPITFNMFDMPNIICDDFEPPLPPEEHRSCDNPNEYSTAHWTADGWEYRLREGSYVWEFENRSTRDATATLTHKPVAIQTHFNDNPDARQPIIITFDYWQRDFGSAPGLDLRVEARGSSTASWKRVEVLVIVRSAAEAFVFPAEIARELYTDEFEFRFSLSLLHTGKARIDNIALTSVLPLPPSERTTTQATGTSFAAPHVVGAAALIWSAHPDLNYLEVRDLILNNVDKRQDLEDKFITGGSLNVHKALMAADDFILQLSTSAFTVAEGQTAEFSVTLTNAPTTDIVVEVDAPQASGVNLAIETTTLKFTVDNWNEPRTVRITPMKDNNGRDYRTRMVLQVQGSQEVRYLKINVLNTEQPQIVVPKHLMVNEGESTSIEVALSLAIPGNYSIAVTSQDTAVLSVSPTSLVFTPDNWDQAQPVQVTAADDNYYTGHQTTTVVLNADGYAPTTVYVTVLENDYFISARYVSEPFILFSEKNNIVLSRGNIMMQAYTPDGLMTANNQALSWILEDPTMLGRILVSDSYSSLDIDSEEEKSQIAEILAAGFSSVTVTINVAMEASAEALAAITFTIPIIDFSDVNFVNQGATPILTRYAAGFTLLANTESYVPVVVSGPHKGFSLDPFTRGQWSVVREHSDSFFIQSDSDTGDDYLMTRDNIFSTLPNYRSDTVIRVQLRYSHAGFEKDLFIPVEVLAVTLEDLQIRKAGEATAIATVVAGDAYYATVDLSHDFVDVKLRVSYRVEEVPSSLTVSVSGGNSETFTVPTGSTGFIEVEVLLGDRAAHRTVYPVNDGGVAEVDADNDGIPDVAGVTNERNELAVAGTQNSLRAPPQHNLILGNFARLLSFMTEIYSPRLDAIPSQSDPNNVKRQMAAAAALKMLALPPPAEEVFARYAGDGIYDFTVYLPAGESTAYIVIPLASKISGNSEYYKYKAEHDEWVAFDNNDVQSDQYYSAAGSVGGDGEVQCPAADATLLGWISEGILRAGHQCVLLKISDGGPNDADNSVNGVVVDPGIIVMSPSITIELGQSRLLIEEEGDS